MRLRLSARRDLVCQQAVELVTDYLEDALSAFGRSCEGLGSADEG